MATTIEIKAGLELDRAVAGVIGLKCTHRILGDGVEYYVDPRDGTSGIPKRFQPSTDLNAALAAADASFGQYVIRKHGPHRFEFECMFPGDDGWSRCGEQTTANLAICAAILIPSGNVAPS